TAATTRVLLECADFDPRIVRRTARALGLSTDASYRYERGVDVDGMENALHRVAGLIRAVAGAAVREDALDVYPAPTEPLQVSLRPARAARVLGVELPASTIVELLEHIGFE